jgi:hypothetical protein
VRKVAGGVLGLTGLAIMLGLAAFLWWTYQQSIVGLSSNAIAVVLALPLVALGCLAGSHQLLRDRSPN